ncbi:glycosyltransferase family 2 protein [Corynebacterium cystitidis]|uniref:glycosyltransferase family 2 protein n=1 Tax=Corynebacterium cystitidis TaxID=35757 RepID=UPI00211E1716|nr:glycosyltransferase family 2 protein [Corynebacterium cystitidis]
MPKLSVILPAQNAASTVARAVSSTLRALPSDAELVVLDDGSTDHTAASARAGATRKGVVDKRLRIERRDGSGGIATALNWLLHHTDSEFVARMDADDICLPWRFHTPVRALEGGDDVVFSQVNNFTGRKLKPAAPVPIPPDAFSFHLLLTNPVSHPAMVAQRSTLETLGGYRDVPAEDYDLWMRAALHGARLRRVASWGLLYRVHPEQITASPTWRHASWRDPQQAEIFAQLSKKITGITLERLVSIALAPPEEKDAQLRHFEDAVLSAIDALTVPQRLIVKNKLHARLVWARSYTHDTTYTD